MDSYKGAEINTMRELREIWGKSDEEKWLFLSTGGYHGTHLTIDDLESILHNESEFSEDVVGKYWLTILVLFPKKLSTFELIIRWGDVAVDLNDAQWLRERVRETLQLVADSQEGNH
jgi:hypothetical protein